MVAIMGFAQYMLNDMEGKPHDSKRVDMLNRVVTAGPSWTEKPPDSRSGGLNR